MSVVRDLQTRNQFEMPHRMERNLGIFAMPLLQQFRRFCRPSSQENFRLPLQNLHSFDAYPMLAADSLLVLMTVLQKYWG